jgi:hypothetical protein
MWASRRPWAVIVLFDPGKNVSKPVHDTATEAEAMRSSALVTVPPERGDGQAGQISYFVERKQSVVLTVRMFTALVGGQLGVDAHLVLHKFVAV